MSLIGWLRSRLAKQPAWFERVYIVESMTDIPEDVQRDVYVVGRERYKWVALTCPCGCGDRIHVNLMTSKWPYWLLEIQEHRISLFPSLWRPKGTCGSHFWVIDSSIHWARALPENIEWPDEAELFFNPTKTNASPR